MRRSSAPTIRDVAMRVGVHQATASAVLNGGSTSTRVSEGTRNRILQAASELRYSPNVIARGLNGIRLNSLGISFPTIPHESIITDHYSSAILRGIVNTSYTAGYNVLLFHKPWRDVEQSAASFRSQCLDGFLIIAPLAGSDMVSGLSSLGVPLVVISTSSEVHSVPAVGIDNDKIVRLVLDHLFSLGHRRIAHLHLGGDAETYDSNCRMESFLRIMAAAGNDVPPEYLRPIDGAYTPGVYDQTRFLLSLPEPPTALFTSNDYLAFHALELAHEMQVAVPEEFSVVGVDDMRIVSSLPALTTVRQPLVQMAEEATNMLIAQIEGKSVPAKTHWFEPELVVRGSTSKPNRLLL